MTHTIKKVALFATVFAVATVGADKKAVFAALDKVVALDTLVGAGCNVVVAGVNGYVNHSPFATDATFGAKAKSVAKDQFVPVFSVAGKSSFTAKVGEEVSSFVTDEMLADKGLARKDKKVVQQAKTVTYKQAKADATFEVKAAVKEDKDKGTTAEDAVTIKVGDAVDSSVDAEALKKAGFKIDGDKLAVADADVTEDVVKASTEKEVKFDDVVTSTSTKAKGALNVFANVYLFASVVNTVRHLVAKKAAQEPTEEVDTDASVETEEVA